MYAYAFAAIGIAVSALGLFFAFTGGTYQAVLALMVGFLALLLSAMDD